MFRGWGASDKTQTEPKEDFRLSGFGHDDDNFDTTHGSPERQKARLSLQELMASADLSEANNPDDPFATALDNLSFGSDESSLVSSNTPKINIKDPFASDSSEEESSDEETVEETLPAASENLLLASPVAEEEDDDEDEALSLQDDDSGVSETLSLSENRSHESLHSEIRIPELGYLDEANESDQITASVNLKSLSILHPNTSISQSNENDAFQKDHGDLALDNSTAPDISINLSNSGALTGPSHFKGDHHFDDVMKSDHSVGGFSDNNFFKMEKDELAGRSKEGFGQAKEGDEESEDYSDSDSKESYHQQSRLKSESLDQDTGSFDEEEDYTDSEGSECDGPRNVIISNRPQNSDADREIDVIESEKADANVTDREDEDHAANVDFDSISCRGESQIEPLPRFDHDSARIADSIDNEMIIDTDNDDDRNSDAGISDAFGENPDHEVFQQSVVSESEDSDEPESEVNSRESQSKSGESVGAAKSTADSTSNIHLNDEHSADITIDFEVAFLENIEQARQKKERDLQKESGGFFSGVFGRASDIDDGKSLASKSVATNNSKVSGFLGLFGSRESGSRSTFDRDEDDESIESETPAGDQGPLSESLSTNHSSRNAFAYRKSTGNDSENETSELQVENSTATKEEIDSSNSMELRDGRSSTLLNGHEKAESDTNSNLTNVSTKSEYTSDSESSIEDFVPSSRLASQMKEFGFDDLVGDGVDFQPPDRSDDDEDNSSVSGSMSELVEAMQKPISDAKSVASSPHPSTTTTDKQAQGERSFHSDVSSMHDDDNIPLDSISAAEVSEKESQSSGSYETESSDDDASFKLGPKEAPLLRLENVTAMTRNIIPDDKIAASNKKNSGAWFGWGRKPVGKSPVPAIPPSPSPSQMSSVASSAHGSVRTSSSQSSLPPFPSVEASKTVQVAEPKKKERSEKRQDTVVDYHPETSASHSARTAPRTESISTISTVDSPKNRPTSKISSNSFSSNSLLSPRRTPSRQAVNFSSRNKSESKSKSNVDSPISGSASVALGDASVTGGMSVFSGFSGDGKRRRRKKKKGLGDHLGKVRKVGRHGDEISVGTLSKQIKTGNSGAQQVMLNTTRDIFGHDDLDGDKKPWEGAKEKKRKDKKAEKLQKRNSSIQGFFPDTFGAEDIILEEHTDA